MLLIDRNKGGVTFKQVKSNSQEEEDGYDTGLDEEASFSSTEEEDNHTHHNTHWNNRFPINYNYLSESNFFPSVLNNYFNNLNLSVNFSHLNDKFNASIWKLYENTPPFPHLPPISQSPSFAAAAVSNLYKQLVDEEFEAQSKRQEFEQVQRKAAVELRKRLESNNKTSNRNRRLRLRNNDTQLNQQFEEQSFNSSSEESSQSQEENDPKRLLLEKPDLHHRRKKSHQSFIEQEEEEESFKRDSEESETTVPLDDEFWSQFFGFDSTDLKVQSSSMDVNQRPPLNAFYSRLHLTAYDIIKTGLLTVTILPFRILGIIVCLTFLFLFSFAGTIGLSFEDSSKAPLSNWRRGIRWFCAHVIMRCLFFCVGFHWIKRKGKKATRQEAPILVVAPHSSYFDSFAVPICGGASVFGKDESKKTPIFGRLINFTQPIYVKREDASSRQESVRTLLERVRSVLDWPQVFIFPEGTTTNRSVLAQFKPGAFLAGVPVQPVVLRYPNRLDTVTWTWDSPSVFKTIWLSLTQFHNSFEIEFLPVYVPSKEEKNDAILFAKNVQKVMAQALSIPTTDFTFEDGKTLLIMSETRLRQKLEYMWKIKGDLNLRQSATETTLLRDGINTPNFNWNCSLDRFLLEIFNIRSGPVTPTEIKIIKEIKALFNLFKEKGADTIDLRAYCFLDFIMYSAENKFDLIVRLVCRTYNGREATTISREVFATVMKKVFETEENNANEVFFGRNNPRNVSVISYQDFYAKIIRRVEYVKLYAMEATGQRSGNYCKRDERDIESRHFHTD